MNGVMCGEWCQDQEGCLVERFRQGDDAARGQMMDRGRALAEGIATYYSRQGVNQEDLMLAGMRAFFHCLDTFDPLRGIDFLRYATWWMKYGMSAVCGLA